jgi:peroxiredoxin
MKLTRHLAVALTVLAIVAAACGAYALWSGDDQPQIAPDAAFTRLDGSRSSVAQLKGQVVLVNFWATTCSTCVHEMPQVVGTHNRFKARGFETLAVAMSYDPPASVIHFAESRRLPFTVVIDNTGAVADSFGPINGTPTTVLINKRGEIVKRYVGQPDFAALQALVEKLLAEA